MNVTVVKFYFGLALLAFVVRPVGARAADDALPVPAVTPDYLVQNWQSNEGLPRNSISSLVQDKLGYLWLGTPYGLIRFDGVQFLALEEKVSPLLALGRVQQLFCDDQNNLWITTRRSGLLRSPAGNFFNVEQTSLSTIGSMDSIAQDGQGTLWATTGDGVLERLSGGTVTAVTNLSALARGPMLFKLVTDAKGGLWFYKQNTYGRLVAGQPVAVENFGDGVVTLAASRDGGLWLSTGYNLRKIPAGQTASTNILAQLSFGTYGISALYEDRAGTLWVGTGSRGLFRLRGSELELVANIHHRIWNLREDLEGNLWVGTEGAGLFKIRPCVFNLLGFNPGQEGEAINSVSEDWLAPFAGGVRRLRPEGGMEILPSYERSVFASVLADGAGGVWLGTTAGRLFHQSADGQRLPPVAVGYANTQLRVLHRDRQGNLWIGCFPLGLFRLPAGDESKVENLSASGFASAPVTAIAEAADGAVWIGGGNGELFRWQAGKFQKFGAASGFSGFTIGALLPTADGGLWVGTLGGGLGWFDGSKLQMLGEESGLSDNVISQLIQDGSGRLWIGSSRGIFRADTEPLRAWLTGGKNKNSKAAVIHFGRADGLANVQCTAEHQPSAWLTHDGQLQFATSKGVLAFNPAAIPVNPLPPPLNLEGVFVDGVAVTNRSALRLPHDYKKIEFRYAAMSFVAPEEVRFKRRLSGFDEDWVADGIERSATYPRLAPGSYEFQFTACNNQGVWNESPVRLRLQVVPAFWQTGWFRVGAVVLFAGAVGGAALFFTRARMKRKLARIEQAHALERERTRISRDLHDDLGARLTQMAFLSDLAAAAPGAGGEIKIQLQDVSRQARQAVQSLDETVWTVNPQKDSLPHLIGYLASYAEQFFRPTPINCRLEICPHPPACPLPGNFRHEIFLLVKEALNNVLKHSGASEVWFRIAVRGPVLRIVIQDNGHGFSPADVKVQRHGLEYMQRRADDAGIKLTLRSAMDAGTKISLRVELPPTKAN